MMSNHVIRVFFLLVSAAVSVFGLMEASWAAKRDTLVVCMGISKLNTLNPIVSITRQVLILSHNWNDTLLYRDPVSRKIVPCLSKSYRFINDKTLYLYHFILFVDWPEEAFPESDDFHVAVMGDVPLLNTMKAFEGKRMKGRRLVVDDPKDIEGLNPTCQVLFVGSSERANANHILKSIEKQSILTVSDMPGFIQMGGMVLFNEEGNPENEMKRKKRFSINLSQVEKAGLKIRSRLLRLSNVVRIPAEEVIPGN